MSTISSQHRGIRQQHPWPQARWRPTGIFRAPIIWRGIVPQFGLDMMGTSRISASGSILASSLFPQFSTTSIHIIIHVEIRRRGSWFHTLRPLVNTFLLLVAFDEPTEPRHFGAPRSLPGIQYLGLEEGWPLNCQIHHETIMKLPTKWGKRRRNQEEINA